MDRGISGDETLIPWIPGSGVLSQEALILRMSHPVPFGTLLLGHSPGSSSSTMEPGESMVVWQALILRMSHPVPRHSLSGTLPRLLQEPGESMVVWQALPDPQGLRVTDPGSPSCG